MGPFPPFCVNGIVPAAPLSKPKFHQQRIPISALAEPSQVAPVTNAASDTSITSAMPNKRGSLSVKWHQRKPGAEAIC